MKYLNFLSVAIALVLVFTAVGCTTMRGADDVYQGRERVYVDDPYRGTVVLEKDPYTGRYYEVNSLGTYNGRYYDRGFSNRRVYSNGHRYSRDNYRRNQNTQKTPSAEQKRQYEHDRNAARKKVLGN